VRNMPSKTVGVSIRLPKKMWEKLEELVNMGLYPSRSEAIRDAIRLLLRKYDFLIREMNGLEETEYYRESSRVSRY